MQDFLPGFDSLGALALLILGFAFVIFVHELGHFLVAKAVNIKVTQFALGFGPPILSWRKGLGLAWGKSTEPALAEKLKNGADAAAFGETEYRCNWLPLGGYVKMVGQDDMDPTALSTDARAFNQKPVWARACVVSAGVTMNLIFGVLFFIVAFLHGVAFPPAIVGSVISGSPAATTYAAGHDTPEYKGLQCGDQIKELDGKPVTDFMDILLGAALAARDQTLHLRVQREGEAGLLTYNIQPKENPTTHILMLGISPPLALQLVNSPHASLPDDLVAAGIAKGMTAVTVNGQKIKRFDQLEKLVTAAQGQPVTVTFADAAGRQKLFPTHAWPELTRSAKDDVENLLGLVPATQVISVNSNSRAQQMGLQPGDLLAKVDGHDWPRSEQTAPFVQAAKGRLIAVTVSRHGQLVDLKPTSPDWLHGRLGMEIAPATQAAVVSSTLPDSPMASRDLPPGSRIVAINDQNVANFGDMQRELQKTIKETGKPAAPLSVSIRYELDIAGRPTYANTITIDPAAAQEIAQAQWLPPPALSGFNTLRIPVVASNPVQAAKLGIEKTHQFVLQTYITLVRLVQGSVPVSGLNGPVGIVKAGTVIARDSGWPYLLFFFGLISVNLVVINFLPLPIVDGGLMVFLLIEKLKGSPVSPKVLAVVNYIGLAMFVSLLLVVTYFDLMR